MTDKFTPGPWWITSEFDDTFIVIEAEDQFIARTTHNNDKANARLIAAAPDLLAALEAVEWWLVPAVQGIGAIYECPWCEQTKHEGHADSCPRQAAIAKARGNERQTQSPNQPSAHIADAPTVASIG